SLFSDIDFLTGRVEQSDSGVLRAVALSAPAPVDDLGLVDREAVVSGRGQARCVANGAVDVRYGTARPAYDVVVVVSHPRFVAGHGALRLDTPHQAGAGQCLEHVVDGLGGHRAEF